MWGRMGKEEGDGVRWGEWSAKCAGLEKRSPGSQGFAEFSALKLLVVPRLRESGKRGQ